MKNIQKTNNISISNTSIYKTSAIENKFAPNVCKTGSYTATTQMSDYLLFAVTNKKAKDEITQLHPLKYNLLDAMSFKQVMKYLNRILKMKPHLLILFAYLIWSNSTLAQVTETKGYSRDFKRAIAAADNSDHKSAIALFSKILEKSPNNVDALTQLGLSYMTMNQHLDSALIFFNTALKNIPQDEIYSPFGIYLQQAIARTHNLNYEPDKALTILTAIKDSINDIELITEINRDITQTRNAALLLKNPVPLRISNIGEFINSEYDDHSPLVSLTQNRIFFTSRRPVGKDRKLSDGQYNDKVFYSEFNGEDWQEPKLISELFSRTEHMSILSLSPDESQIFLFKNENPGKSIYVSINRNGKWEKPEKMPAPISSQWDETHACLAPDQSTLYFTSNRPGGFGGLDIYSVKKDKFGKWEEAINLGPNINSEKDEETPMIHPDGKTLYFASEGHAGMGGVDIFFSQKESDDTWVEAVNMGYPINSPDDDLFFVPTLDKSQAYFSSYRFSDNSGQYDVYRVNFDSKFRGSLAVIEGTIKNSNKLPNEHIRILVSRESDNQQIGDYRPNPVTGKYLLFLETDENYIIKEVTPEAVMTEERVYVSNELAYHESSQVILMQDYKILSPLIPQNLPDESNTASLPAQPTFLLSEPINEINSYTIQILALKVHPKVPRWYFKGLNQKMISAFQGKDEYLRYVIGQFNSMAEAKKYLAEIQKSGRFADAWIRPWGPLWETSGSNNLISLD